MKDGPSLLAQKVKPMRSFACIMTEVHRGPAAINPGFKLLPFIFKHEIFIQKIIFTTYNGGSSFISLSENLSWLCI